MNSIQSFFQHLTNKKVLIMLLSLGCIIYFNSLFNEFVGDDFGQIKDNPTVTSLFNIPQLYFQGTFHSESATKASENSNYYKPLLPTAFTVINVFFLGTSFGFHLVQILMHITNAFLAFVIFKKLLSIEIAFLITLLFLVHPINNEAVIYISALQEPLFVLFGLLALYLEIMEKKNWQSNYLPAVLLLMSLLSKESGFLFIIIFPIFTYLVKKQHLYKSLLQSGGALIAYAFLRFVVAQFFFPQKAVVPIMQLSLWERMQNLPKIIFFYLKTFFYPKDLLIFQSWTIPSKDMENFFVPLTIEIILMITLILVATTIYKKNKHLFYSYIFFAIWFVIGLGLHAQIIPLDQTVADRWFYFPIIGMLGLIGTLLQFLKADKSAKLALIIGIIVIIFSLRVIIRNTNWYNELTLFTHDIQANKDSYQLEMGLGFVNDFQGDFPRNPTEAEKHYKKAITLFPETRTRSALGRFYLASGKLKEAKSIFEEVLKSNPNNTTLLIYLAITEYKLGNKEKALVVIKKAYAIGPNNFILLVMKTIQNNEPINFH